MRIPLTTQKKAELMAGLAFCKTLIRPCDCGIQRCERSTYWLPDPGIMPYLNVINAIPHVATMTSKLAQSGSDPRSYLFIAVDEKAHAYLSPIQHTIQYSIFADKYDDELIFDASFAAGSEPDPAPDRGIFELCGAQIIDDPENYTAVDRWAFMLNSPHEGAHAMFWNNLVRLLQDICN